jgi:hypothetical protein
LVEGIERRDGVRSKLEVKDLRVLDNPRPVRGLGDHGDVPFDCPPEHDLSRSAAVVARHPHDGRVPERLPARQRAIGLESDLQLVAVLEETAPELKRRELDLVDMGPDTTTRNDVIEFP